MRYHHDNDEDGNKSNNSQQRKVQTSNKNIADSFQRSRRPSSSSLRTAISSTCSSGGGSQQSSVVSLGGYSYSSVSSSATPSKSARTKKHTPVLGGVLTTTHNNNNTNNNKATSSSYAARGRKDPTRYIQSISNHHHRSSSSNSITRSSSKNHLNADEDWHHDATSIPITMTNSNVNQHSPQQRQQQQRQHHQSSSSNRKPRMSKRRKIILAFFILMLMILIIIDSTIYWKSKDQLLLLDTNDSVLSTSLSSSSSSFLRNNGNADDYIHISKKKNIKDDTSLLEVAQQTSKNEYGDILPSYNNNLLDEKQQQFQSNSIQQNNNNHHNQPSQLIQYPNHQQNIVVGGTPTGGRGEGGGGDVTAAIQSNIQNTIPMNSNYNHNHIQQQQQRHHHSTRLKYSPGSPKPNQHVFEKMEFYFQRQTNKKYTTTTSTRSRSSSSSTTTTSSKKGLLFPQLIQPPTKKLLSDEMKINTESHYIAGLDCMLYNGPHPQLYSSSRTRTTSSTTTDSNYDNHIHNQDDETSLALSVLQDLVYWQDIPSDSKYTTPFYHVRKKKKDGGAGVNQDKRNVLEEDDDYNGGGGGGGDTRDSLNKYLIFEPDQAGWNNQRMSFETILVLSVAMGRTLVLPPRQGIPMLVDGVPYEQILSYDDFFHLDSLIKEYEGINIITMDEFLRIEGITGKLHKSTASLDSTTTRGNNNNSDSILYPPENRTNWDNMKNINDVSTKEALDPLWGFLQQVSYIADSWNPNECIAAFPASFVTSVHDGQDSKEASLKALSELMEDIIYERDDRPKPHPLDFQGRAMPLNVPPVERLREMLADRSRLCLYDEKMESETVIYFSSENRLLSHYYSFVFFEDWRQATWISRIVRDHIRYRDEIMCASARIITEIRKKGTYHSAHIRRGDFKNFKDTNNISDEVVLESLSEVLLEGSNIFVASDEKDEEFFRLLRERFNLVSLSDFDYLLTGINPNYYGMIEQMVAAKGEIFFGSYFSTFSGYITRIRGYYAERDGLIGYEEGKLANTFYMPDLYRNELRIYKAIHQPFFAREFPVGWRDINRGVGEMIWEGW